MNAWLTILTFTAPVLIAYKHSQQAAHMLEGWALRKHIKIENGMKVLIADRARMTALGISVFGGEVTMAIIVFQHDQITSPTSIVLLFLSGLIVLTGALLTARATLSIYDRFER